jgi:glutamate dehydrogenase
MLRARSKAADLPTLIARYQPGARELRAHLENWLPASALASWEQAAQKLEQAGVAPELARKLSALEFIFPALDLVDLTEQANTTLAQAAQTYFGVDSVLGLSAWRAQINRLPTDSLWQTQARGSAREDVYAIANQICLSVLQRFDGVTAWSEAHAASIERLCKLLQTISTQAPDLAPVSVALRELRHLI